MKGKNLSLDGVADAVEAVAPALEFIEKRSPFGSGFSLAIAGNAQKHAFVTGTFIPFTPNIDLSHVTATVFINNEKVKTATGAEVLGTPLESVRWLSKKLATFDRQLEPGALIMTGSFTKQYDIKLGDEIKTEFKGISITSAIFR